MAITDVSTRSVAEIDLGHSRISAFFPQPSLGAHLENCGFEAAVRSTESSGLPPGVFSVAKADEEQYDVIVGGTSSVFTPLRATQIEKVVGAGGQPEGFGQACFRASFDDVAGFAQRTYVGEPCSVAAPSHLANRQTIGRAFTNWLRLIADDEPSRPILDIEAGIETPDRPAKAKSENRVSVSPGLQRKEPKATTSGLGYVSAGLLLWLESSSEPEEDD